MKIDACMKRNVIFIHQDTTVIEAANLMVHKHIGILPVVDGEAKLVGVIHLRDLMTLELPGILELIEDVDFVHDFGVVETTRPERKDLDRPVTTIMRPVHAVDENCGLLRAYALMDKEEVMDLPVVNDSGKLVGIVSRVDIGTAVLTLWQGRKSG